MSGFIKTHRIAILLMLSCVLFYLSFAYDLVRSDFIKLISLYTGLFFLSWKLIQTNRENFWLLAGFGIVCRLLFIGALPNLSQDFFRFLWDGRLLLKGISPYSISPQTLMQINTEMIPQAQLLFDGMGDLSARHFSNYPPVNQYFFGLAAIISGKSILGQVIVLRLLIVAADIGILYFGRKILRHLKLDEHNIFWYFLNPFIIIELTGNLHFEGVMLFFYIWSLFVLIQGKWLWAAVLLGLSVSVKLLPLLFLPLFYQWFVKKNTSSKGLMKLTAFYIVTGSIVVLSFVPFLSAELLSNFWATLSLWFQEFEFNASIHYVIRWIALKVVGWNIIETTGKILPLIVLLIVVALTFLRKNHTPKQRITSMVLTVSFYFLLSTTIHPWYLATPLLLCVFSTYQFPLVWSFTVFLSYSAYGPNGFEENHLLIAIEYLLVAGFAIWEFFIKKKKPEQPVILFHSHKV